jgi:probable rRNA maturation factor
MSSGGSTFVFRFVPAHLRLSAEQKRTLEDFAGQLVANVAGNRPFICLVTSDKELHRLNKHFLNHDYPTDVLSFPSAPDSPELGELAISIERAHVQAASYRHNVLDELRILILHGVLHLTGMDHERDRGEMARAERTLRKQFGLPPNLIARMRA